MMPKAAAKTIIESDQVTSAVTVTDIISGEHPAILTAERVVDSQGNARLITQKIPVRDAALFERLWREVGLGEEISVTTVTEWYEDGYAAYLADFSRIAPASSVPAPRALAATP